MDTAAKTFLFDLLSTPSPTGFELAGQRKWAAYVRNFSDRVEIRKHAASCSKRTRTKSVSS
jgi:hypothetical protein